MWLISKLVPDFKTIAKVGYGNACSIQTASRHIAIWPSLKTQTERDESGQRRGVLPAST